tara:strand:+ start:713 stop:1540 length:828 start_codon:yes stop_codon:yes gene_type:complete
MLLNLGSRTLDLSKPKIMGVLNITPDSFSDGGKYQSLDQALSACEKMIDEGASIIDVGGESTKPGSSPIEAGIQIDRVIPVIQSIKKNFDTIVSVDTGDPVVMREAIKNGAEIVNDVYALKNTGAMDFLSGENKAICLMHMKGSPSTMQENPVYDDLMTEIKDFLEERINFCLRAGKNRESLIIDPGFGFGKTLRHNILLLKNIEQLKYLKVPICIGISRKSFIGKITNKTINERLYGSLGATLIALQNGANIIRTHDVGPTTDIINLYNSLNNI